MKKSLRSLLLVTCILIACMGVSVITSQLFAFDESPTTAPQPPTPSLTSGINNPYIATQKWIEDIAEEDKTKILGDLQPGSAVYMRELAQRITDMYFAVRSGNWKLADYQLEYARKNMQSNRVTRPKRHALFTSYLTDSIGDETNPAPGTLQEAINAENVVAFNKALKLAITNCNACHVATDHDYIMYQIPKKGPFVPLHFAPMKEAAQ